MANSINLRLPYLAAEQAQKHVTMNGALGLLDLVVQLRAINRTRTSPPGSPVEGDNYIVAASPTGSWAGHENDIACYVNGSWVFLTPQTGWHCWVIEEGATTVYSGSAWQGGPSFFTMKWTHPTIASGVLTITSSAVAPAPESGGTDDITSISGGQDGTYLIIAGTNGKTINLIDGGNLKLGDTSRTLSNFDDTVSLIKRGTDWLETGYGNNG